MSVWLPRNRTPHLSNIFSFLSRGNLDFELRTGTAMCDPGPRHHAFSDLQTLQSAFTFQNVPHPARPELASNTSRAPEFLNFASRNTKGPGFGGLFQFGNLTRNILRRGCTRPNAPPPSKEPKNCNIKIRSGKSFRELGILTDARPRK